MEKNMSAINRNIPEEKRLANEEGVRGTVAGLFRDHSRAEQALEKLKAAGFSDDRIGIATAESDNQAHSGFWDKFRNRFGERDHTRKADDFRGSLTEQGIPAHEVRYFDDQLRSGGILVTVRTDEGRAIEALRILHDSGADTGSGAVSYSDAKQGEVGTAEERRIELLGEVLRVHKERVQRGEVRIRKEVVTEPQHNLAPVGSETRLLTDLIPLL